MSNWNTRGRIILMALVVSILVVPVALAKDKPPGAGKPEATGANCKPRVSAILKGTLTAVDNVESGLSVTLTVDRTNKFARILFDPTPQSVTVRVNGPNDSGTDTRIKRNGPATLANFVTGDRVMAQLRVCKQDADSADTVGEWTTILANTFATRVVAHPATS